MLKWPNDILISYDDKWRKVCGILIESKSSGSDNTIIAGIGINLSGEYKDNFDIPVGFVKEFSNQITFEKIHTVLNAILASNFERIDVLPEITFNQIEKRINLELQNTFSRLNNNFYRKIPVEFSRILEDGSIEIKGINGSSLFSMIQNQSTGIINLFLHQLHH